MMKQFFDTYKWLILGSILGIIIAVLFISLGFFKSILIILLGGLGGLLGFYLDRSGILKK